MKSRMLLITLVVLSVFSVLPERLYAQTKFDQNLDSPDLTTYIHPDECNQVITRMYTIKRNKYPIWLDTVEFSYDVPPYLRDKEADSVGRACLAKFNIEEFPSEYNYDWAFIYLSVGDTDKFEKLFGSLIDSVEIKNKAELYARFFRDSDYRLHSDLYRKIYAGFLTNIPRDSVLERVGVISAYANAQLKAGNFNDAGVSAIQLMDEIESAPDSVRNSNHFKIVVMISSMQIFLHTTYQEGLDSIRTSTDAYFNYYRGIFRRVMNDSTIDSIPTTIGKKFPDISGDFYFANVGDTVPGEAFDILGRGTPALVIRVDGSCHSSKPLIREGRQWPGQGYCERFAASIRRTMNKFPGLDLVIVSTTFGILGDGSPIAPREEAILLHKYVTDHFGLRGRMVIAETPFHRIQSPDARRVDLPSDMVEKLVASGVGLGSPGAVLLDSDGRVVISSNAYFEEEPKLVDAIRALLAR